MSAENREQELEDTVEILNQKLSALTGSSRELGILTSLGYGMTQRLAQMLFILVKRSPALVSIHDFHTVIYNGRDDGGPEPRIFGIHIHRLRGVLERVGAQGKIKTVWNAGYRASPELVSWIKDLYTAGISKED